MNNLHPLIAAALAPYAPKPAPCQCDAYAFPHRALSGQCQVEQRQVVVSVRNLDHILDDPRRGQAAWINKG